MDRSGLIFVSQVSNAGTGIMKPALGVTPEEYKFITTTNFESAFHLCQLAHPLLKASGRGTIVFNSSIAGLVGIDMFCLYAATKGLPSSISRQFIEQVPCNKLFSRSCILLLLQEH